MLTARTATFWARQRGRGDDDHLGPGEHAGQAHLHVAGAGRHVDEQVVEVVAPGDVLEEVLHGPVEHEAPPHERRLLVLDQEAHRHDLEHARRRSALVSGTIILRRRAPWPCEPAVDAEHAGDREAPDVGVEHADREARVAASAAARLTVTDDLPTPPLPEAIVMTWVVAGIAVSAASSLATFHRALAMARGLLVGGHLGPVELHAGHAGQRADPGADVALDLGPQRAAGGGQGDGDGDRAVVGDRGALGHAQLDDVAAQLGVDDAAEQCSMMSSEAGRDAGHVDDSTGRGRETRGCGPVASILRGRRGRDEAADAPRLDILKALGDNTRYAIYLELARSPAPAGHRRGRRRPRPARQHRAAPPRAHARRRAARGRSSEPRGGVGRPQHLYSLAADAPRSGSSRRRSRCWPACCCAWPPPAGARRRRAGSTPAATRAGPTPSACATGAVPRGADRRAGPPRGLRPRGAHRLDRSPGPTDRLRPLPVPGPGRGHTPTWCAACTAAWSRASSTRSAAREVVALPPARRPRPLPGRDPPPGRSRPRAGPRLREPRRSVGPTNR